MEEKDEVIHSELYPVPTIGDAIAMMCEGLIAVKEFDKLCDKLCDEWYKSIMPIETPHEIESLKKRIKHCKNPLELKQLQRKLNTAYKREKEKKSCKN